MTQLLWDGGSNNQMDAENGVRRLTFFLL